MTERWIQLRHLEHWDDNKHTDTTKRLNGFECPEQNTEREFSLNEDYLQPQYTRQ